MTREEAIRHWATAIIPVVFQAEKNLECEWSPRLQEAKFHDDAYQEKVANEYINALANEIVARRTD